jgi:hypothetical protein
MILCSSRQVRSTHLQWPSLTPMMCAQSFLSFLQPHFLNQQQVSCLVLVLRESKQVRSQEPSVVQKELHSSLSCVLSAALTAPSNCWRLHFATHCLSCWHWHTKVCGLLIYFGTSIYGIHILSIFLLRARDTEEAAFGLVPILSHPHVWFFTTRTKAVFLQETGVNTVCHGSLCHFLILISYHR